MIPYIEQVVSISPEFRVLEIGCGEGGNIEPFLDLGCQCVGIDIDVVQLENAKKYLSSHPGFERVTFIANDINKVSSEDIGCFDLIILRDVIEHIPNQEQFLHHLKDFMHAHTVVFFGFPVWCNPFGGHQQICCPIVYTAKCCNGEESQLVPSKPFWRSRQLVSVCTDLSELYIRSNTKYCSTLTISLTQTMR